MMHRLEHQRVAEPFADSFDVIGRCRLAGDNANASLLEPVFTGDHVEHHCRSGSWSRDVGKLRVLPSNKSSDVSHSERRR